MIYQTVQHPIPSATAVVVARPGGCIEKSAVVCCEGQMGRNRIWWYRLANGKRANEYDIVSVK